MAAEVAAGATFHELKAVPVIEQRIATLHLSAAERLQIVRWVRSPTTAHRLVVRSRIVLLASEGLPIREICHRVPARPAAVRLWCDRFRRHGLLAIQRDAPGRGRRPGMATDIAVRVLSAMTGEPPSRGWTARSLAARAGTSAATVWRIWQRTGLHAASTAAQIANALARVRADRSAQFLKQRRRLVHARFLQTPHARR